MARISCGAGRSDFWPLPPLSEAVSSRMMSLHSSMHSSQMNTDGPAMSLRTSCWLLPQKEQYNNLSPEVLSAIDEVKTVTNQGPGQPAHGKTLPVLTTLLQDLVHDAV